MDRILISLKFTMLSHSTKGLRRVGWVIGAVLVLATWSAAVLSSGDEVRSTVLCLALLGWGVGAAIGPVLLSGNGVLRPEYFALLPIPGRTLARGLLLSNFVSIAAAFVLVAYLSVTVHAWSLASANTVVAVLAVAVVGAPLTWILVVTSSRLVYALLGAAMRSKLGVEIAGIQFGLMFAVIFTGWMVVQVAAQSIPALLQNGLPAGAVTSVLDAVPTSWVVLATENAAAGRWGTAVALLAALALLDAVVVVATVALLIPRPSARERARRARPRSPRLVAGGGWLPATQLGAVVGKEWRQWRRDPWRSLEIRSCVWTGIAIGLFAYASGQYAALAAFAGLIIALMLGLGACNLYGQDGTAVWQNVVGQDATSVRSDVRGRQLAALLVFAPQAFAISVAFVLLSGQWWTIPVLLAALPAAFGVASGVAVLVSAIGVSPGVDPRQRVGPNDANGNISLHVWVVMVGLALGVLPTVVAIVVAMLVPSPWSVAAMVAVGIGNGWVGAWLLGRITIARLSDRMPDIYSRIRYGRIFRDNDSSLLAGIENATLRGEQQMREQRQKEREQKMAASADRP